MVASEPGVLDVWTIDLALKGQLDTLVDVLDHREQAQARRYRSDQHARRYIVAHAATRFILSGYTGIPAAQLVFEINAYGKPSLAGQAAPSFNLSHADDTALCAVTACGAVGVDIERCSACAPLDRVDQFFSVIERQALDELANGLKNQGFFACWTRKEAYIKAKGSGLSLPLDAFSVEVHPERPARLIASAFAPDDVGRFQFWDLPAAQGYRAALAYCGDPVGPPTCREWLPDTRSPRAP